MCDLMENAFRAKMDFSILMGPLRVKTSEEELGTYVQLYRDEKLDITAEERLEWLRPVLADLAKEYGCRYETPILSDDSRKLLAETPLQFIKRYAEKLKMLDMDPFSTSYI